MVAPPRAAARSIDRDLKRRAYEEHGIPSCWLVDPQEPSVTVLELETGRCVERARATGKSACEVHASFELTLVPAAPRRDRDLIPASRSAARQGRAAINREVLFGTRRR